MQSKQPTIPGIFGFLGCFGILVFVPFIHPIAILAMLIAVSVHECAHAWMAKRLGDDTAEHAGRLTLNPLSHIDPLGALMFLIVGFGWARPVPVDPSSFRHPKRDNAVVALAGPASNLILAFLAFIGLALLMPASPQSSMELLSIGDGGSVTQVFLTHFFAASLFVNLALMAFNLLPIAPLDGSKIIEPFVPLSLQDAYDAMLQYGPFILLGLILFESFLPVRILSGWVHGIVDIVLTAFAALPI
ncbi:MAG: peptidase M50 [Candidatus Peregrinibacteria bacterium Gr01-1014_25]|nr:MAG: peptidase M50 [Candidatus Peregrinibacteria bacterium Gr01-1014_25]